MGTYVGYFKLGMLSEGQANVEASSLEEARKKVEAVSEREGGGEVTDVLEITESDPIALNY